MNLKELNNKDLLRRYAEAYKNSHTPDMRVEIGAVMPNPREYELWKQAEQELLSRMREPKE